MCRARPEVNRSEVFRGRSCTWFCNHCKISSRNSEMQLVGVDGWRSTEQTRSSAVPERTHIQWNPRVKRLDKGYDHFPCIRFETIVPCNKQWWIRSLLPKWSVQYILISYTDCICPESLAKYWQCTYYLLWEWSLKFGNGWERTYEHLSHICVLQQWWFRTTRIAFNPFCLTQQWGNEMKMRKGPDWPGAGCLLVSERTTAGNAFSVNWWGNSLPPFSTNSRSAAPRLGKASIHLTGAHPST